MIIDLTIEQKEKLRPLIDAYWNFADDWTVVSYKADAQRFYEWYHGRLPLIQTESGVDCIDRTCYEQVNGALKDLLEVFCTDGFDPVSFHAIDVKDAYAAKAATKLVNQAIQSNQGYNVFSSAFLEALITRTSFIKRYWGESTEVLPLSAHGLSSEDEATAVLSAWVDAGFNLDNDSISLVGDEEKGTWDLDALYVSKTEGVKIEFVPVEEILMDQQAKSIKDATYFCHRVKKSKSELMQMGFTKEEVDAMPLVTMTMLDADYENVQQARSNFRRYWDQDIGSNSDDGGSKVWMYEHYVRTDYIDPTKPAQLYQILDVHNTTDDEKRFIHCETVSEIPFTVVNPLPVPNQLFGESLVDLTKDIQEKKTFIQRAIIDNANISAHPRYTAIQGAYDRRSLLDNVPGGVVEMDRPDAINQLVVPQLSPTVMGLFQLIDGEAEKRTGVNDTQAGNTTNALENSRMSEESVNNMITLAQGKVRMMARNLANDAMTDLFKAVYRLIRENADTPVEVLTAQGLVTVSPKDLPYRDHVKVAVALTGKEKEKRASDLLAVAQFTKMVGGQSFVSPANTAYWLYEFAQAKGFDNIYDLFTPIEQYQPPQPDPLSMATVADKQADAQLKQAQTNKLINDAHLEVEKLAFEQQKAADETQLKHAAFTVDQQVKADTHLLEQSKVANEAMKDANAHERHKDQHAVEVYKAETEDRDKQAKRMLEGAALNQKHSVEVTV